MIIFLAVLIFFKPQCCKKKAKIYLIEHNLETSASSFDYNSQIDSDYSFETSKDGEENFDYDLDDDFEIVQAKNH